MSRTLSRPLSDFQGVGPRRSALLANLGVRTVRELLTFYPRRYEDRRSVVRISSLVPGRAAVVRASVDSVERRRLPNRGLELVVVSLSDGSGTMKATWFNSKGLGYILKEGTTAMFYGVPSLRFTTLEMTNPEFEVCGGGESAFTGIIPIYPSTAGLPVKWFRRFAADVIEKALPAVEETLPQSIINKRSLMVLREALRAMHRPESPEEWKEARRRLAYEEFLFFQTAVALRRREIREKHSAAVIHPGAVYKEFRAALPFSLTASQESALADIFADTQKEYPMSRLVQGDVGSGKTLIAVGLAAAAADSGVQCALMAPTEVLARQLHAQCLKWLSPLGVQCVLLKGALSASERRAALAAIADGSASVATGTQALISEGVTFKKLGAAIVDEQHRFGVAQRAALLHGDSAPHMLMMSATPIPRTLAMCCLGDLDTSVLSEKPAGRHKTETRMIDVKKLRTLMQFLIDEAAAGGRIYWICPRVGEEGTAEMASAEKRCAFLQKHLGSLGVGLLHGRMESEEKDKVLDEFRNGAIKLLVGTTVVEVGVDVPEASVIVIESPERFGLSQLHQLRGRVGRGARRGVCVLLVSDMTGEIPERLSSLLRTDDGFEIAEADLAFRGAGELGGAAQHGAAEFKVADLSKDINLLLEAKEDAAEWTERDPKLTEAPLFAPKLERSMNKTLIGG